MAPKGHFKYHIPEKKLRYWYLSRGKSLGWCANYFHCSIAVIRHRLWLFGIKIRPRHKFLRLKLSPKELAYLAGFIDGDGSITVQQKGQHRKQEQPLSKDHPGQVRSLPKGHATPRPLEEDPILMDLIKRNVSKSILLDDSRIFFHPLIVLTSKNTLFPKFVKNVLKPLKPEKRPHKGTDFVWTLRIEGYKILPLLEAIRPYLKLRRPQCNLVISYIKSRLKNEPKEYTRKEKKILALLAILNQKGHGTQSGKNDVLVTLNYLTPNQVIALEK